MKCEKIKAIITEVECFKRANKCNFPPRTPGVQQHGAPVHVHAVQPEPVVV